MRYDEEGSPSYRVLSHTCSRGALCD